MKLSMVILLLAVSGCSDKSETIYIRGENGYSTVSHTNFNSSLCGSSGGTEVFMALDLNRDLQFSVEDEIQNQFVLCNGENGRDGLAGENCTVSKVGNQSTIRCGTSSTVVLDGDKGDKGDRGDTGPTPSGIFITEIVNLCGSSTNDEIFLRLSNGELLALYDGGPVSDRLTLIAPGNYMTTDSSGLHCYFTITSDKRIINEVLR